MSRLGDLLHTERLRRNMTLKQVAKLGGANAAEGEEEVVVTGGATAGLNLLATAFGQSAL